MIRERSGLELYESRSLSAYAVRDEDGSAHLFIHFNGRGIDEISCPSLEAAVQIFNQTLRMGGYAMIKPELTPMVY
jgi:hypothetical protein